MANEEFSNLFIQNQHLLQRYARSLTWSKQSAQDLVQNAAIKAHLSKSKLQDANKFRAWFRRIIYNTYITEYNKRVRRQKLMRQNGAHTGSFFNRHTCQNLGLEKLKKEDIVALKSRVNQDGYKAFAMHVKGYTYKEISKMTKISVGTVKSRIYNTKKNLGRLVKAQSIAA